MCLCDKAKRLTGAHGHAAGYRAASTMRQRAEANDLGMDDVRRHALALLDRGLELKP